MTFFVCICISVVLLDKELGYSKCSMCGDILCLSINWLVSYSSHNKKTTVHLYFCLHQLITRTQCVTQVTEREQTSNCAPSPSSLAPLVLCESGYLPF